MPDVFAQNATVASKKPGVSEYQKSMAPATGYRENFGKPEIHGLYCPLTHHFLKFRNMSPKISPPLPAVQVVSDLADVGRQVRAHRKLQGLRIDDAAALNGVSVDLLSRLENGAGGIRTDKLLAVLDGLGLALVIAPKDHELLQRLPQDRLNGNEAA
ncbi:MAG TPA: helix-turn-helix domain-containing protein [Pseudoduganella sp.]